MTTAVAALTLVGTGVVAQARAATAADLAALAAADAAAVGRADACALGAVVADRNGAQLVSCVVAGDEVKIEVRVAARPLPDAHARAHAGPGPVPDAHLDPHAQPPGRPRPGAQP